MASSIPAVLFLIIAAFCLTAVAEDCDGYTNSAGIYRLSQDCSFMQFCCGTCDNRYCCSNIYSKLNDDSCLFNSHIETIPIVSAVVGFIIFIIFIVTCCVCPCCCLYKMCRKPRPVMATTTVVTSQYPQQPTVNPTANPQYLPYQHVPAQQGFGPQPGYGTQSVPAAPYPGQPYAPGPPPPYQESVYPAPYSQAAYDGGHIPYPVNPPMQPGFAHPPPATNFNAAQPPYNPAFVDPPKTGY